MQNPLHVLLVDDHVDFLETVSFWMKSKGYVVSVANNAEEALQAVKTEAVDIVFLDMHMPKTNGVQTLSQIRTIKKDLPVILVTAYLEDALIDQAREFGISGLFPKEGSFDKLLSVIEVALRTHRRP